MTKVLLNPSTNWEWTTTPSLPMPLPIHLKIGGLSLIAVHVKLKTSPAVGWLLEASMLMLFVKEAVYRENSVYIHTYERYNDILCSYLSQSSSVALVEKRALVFACIQTPHCSS